MKNYIQIEVVMKNFFVINPVAGVGKGEIIIKEQIEKMSDEIKSVNTFEFLLTEKTGDATILAKDVCDKFSTERINIFACGGDGTCFEVLNGIAGYENVCMGIIPVGSCNDFLKTFSEYDFLDVEKQLMGNVIKMDIINVNNEYVLNVANFGFDARANHDQIRYRSRFKSVKSAYNYALFRNIISPKLGDKVEILVDDEKVFTGKMLLSSIANAMYYGGGYKCAPNAKYNDGLLEICIVKKVSIFTFAKLVKYYKRGEHINNPKFKKYLTYLRGKKIEIRPIKELVGCFDGETRISKSFSIEVLRDKINFILPN